MIDKYQGLSIGIPIMRDVTMDWALMFRRLQLPPDVEILSNKGVPIDVARNVICDNFLRSNKEWLFFLDSDIHIEPDVIMKMISRGYPLLSGIYYTRFPPIEPACWRLTSKGKEAINFKYGELVQADCSGAGCLLIHRSVLESIDKPYFLWTLNNRQDKYENMSEDFYFFRKAKDAGFQLLVDTNIICKHECNTYIDGYGKTDYVIR